MLRKLERICQCKFFYCLLNKKLPKMPLVQTGHFWPPLWPWYIEHVTCIIPPVIYSNFLPWQPQLQCLGIILINLPKVNTVPVGCSRLATRLDILGTMARYLTDLVFLLSTRLCYLEGDFFVKSFFMFTFKIIHKSFWAGPKHFSCIPIPFCHFGGLSMTCTPCQNWQKLQNGKFSVFWDNWNLGKGLEI